jgi:hypothetical protein
MDEIVGRIHRRWGKRKWMNEKVTAGQCREIKGAGDT